MKKLANGKRILRALAVATALAAGAAKPLKLTMVAKPHNAPDAARISHWLQELKSPAQARAATLRLVAAGRAAVPALTSALQTSRDASLHKALLAALIANLKARSQRGPLVTLSLQNAPIALVVKRLCKEVGCNAELSGRIYHERLTVLVRRQPIWRVLRRISQLVAIRPADNSYRPMGVEFAHHGFFGKGSRSVVDGAGLVALDSVARHRVLDYCQTGPLRIQRQFRMHLALLWAPISDQIIEQVGPPKITEIVRGTGGKMLMKSSVKGSTLTVPPAILYDLGAALHWPPRGRRRTLGLRGVVPVSLAICPETHWIKHLARGNAALYFDGMHLFFGKPRPAAGQWKVTLKIRVLTHWCHVGKQGFVGTRMGFRVIPLLQRLSKDLFNGRELRFRGAGGKYLPVRSHTGGAPANMGWGYYKYTINLSGGRPASARVRFPSQSVVVQVPFDFKNLPLPR